MTEASVLELLNAGSAGESKILPNFGQMSANFWRTSSLRNRRKLSYVCKHSFLKLPFYILYFLWQYLIFAQPFTRVYSVQIMHCRLPYILIVVFRQNPFSQARDRLLQSGSSVRFQFSKRFFQFSCPRKQSIGGRSQSSRRFASSASSVRRWSYARLFVDRGERPLAAERSC